MIVPSVATKEPTWVTGSLWCDLMSGQEVKLLDIQELSGTFDRCLVSVRLNGVCTWMSDTDFRQRFTPVRSRYAVLSSDEDAV